MDRGHEDGRCSGPSRATRPRLAGGARAYPTRVTVRGPEGSDASAGPPTRQRPDYEHVARLERVGQSAQAVPAGDLGDHPPSQLRAVAVARVRGGDPPDEDVPGPELRQPRF